MDLCPSSLSLVWLLNTLSRGSHLCQLWSSIRSERPLWEDVTRDMISCVYIPPSSFPASLSWTFSFLLVLFRSLSRVVSTDTLEHGLSLALHEHWKHPAHAFLQLAFSFMFEFLRHAYPALRACVPWPCLYSVLSGRQTSLVLCVWSLASSCFQELISNCKGGKKLLWIFLLLNTLCDAYWVSYSKSGIDESEGKCIHY